MSETQKPSRRYPFAGFSEEQMNMLARKAKSLLDLAPADPVYVDARGIFTNSSREAVIRFTYMPGSTDGDVFAISLGDLNMSLMDPFHPLFDVTAEQERLKMMIWMPLQRSPSGPIFPIG